MPDEIAARLEDAGLRAAYDARPAYQRNDYLGWIARAKRPETREKRIAGHRTGIRASRLMGRWCRPPPAGAMT
ncbi:MAG: YdeI/OmpD-associated family protein [Maritimibacter sp.]